MIPRRVVANQTTAHDGILNVILAIAMPFGWILSQAVHDFVIRDGWTAAALALALALFQSVRHTKTKTIFKTSE